MAKNTVNGENPGFELVAPVKILVKPSSKGDGEGENSLRRRSNPSNEASGSHPHQFSGGRESDNIYLVSDHSKQLQTKESQKEASIQIHDGEKKNVAYYLQHCFRLMYFTGMSTYNPDMKDDGMEESWMATILNILQKVVFWIVALLSLAFAFLNAKLHWLSFLSDVGVLSFVYFGSWLFAIVSEIYFIYFFAYHHKRIKVATEALNAQGSYTIEHVGNKKWKCRHPRKLITVLFIATITACFMSPLGGSGDQGWSPEKLVLDSSKKLSYQLFIWNPDDLVDDGNSTNVKVEGLKRDYGTQLTPLTVIMGISQIGMQFSSNMKMDTAQNMGVVFAVLIWLRNRYFGKKLKKTDFKNYANGNDIEELDSPDGLFAELKQMKKENRQMNGLAGGLLKIVHAYNLLQCANFLMRCLDRDASLTQFLFMVFGLVKVGAMYYFGKKAEAENELYEEWIREWAMHSRDPIFLIRVLVILDGMTKEPLGIGRGNFLVGHGFIFRFIGFVGSIFMLEVDNDDDNE